MSKCCNEERDTKYCSECGKKLFVDESIEALVVHCRKVAINQKSRANTLREHREDSVTAREDSVIAQEADGIAKKWEHWADWVEARINK